MSVRNSLTASAIMVACAASVAAGQITVPTVRIGNPGNAPDASTGLGAVTYVYRIGTTEVTQGQYTAFLNAVARTDTFGVYNLGMTIVTPGGGIIRSGLPGSYTYHVSEESAPYPVNFVSFWDACRFANWLHNGQPTGLQTAATTEDGAYTLTPSGIAANTIVRNPGWKWAVTSENEWYKAAYFQPANQGGDTDNYWLYPTSSNTIPTFENANYGGSFPVPVAQYAPNFHGAFDMAANLYEWTESIENFPQFQLFARIIRGGSFNDDDGLESWSRITLPVTTEEWDWGFRVSRLQCRADVNDSGAVSVQDFFDFLAAYFAPGTAGDFNADNVVTVQDIFDFMAEWFVGC